MSEQEYTLGNKESPESFLYRTHKGFENVLECVRHHQSG